MEKVNSSVIKIREYIIMCVIVKAENTKEMIELAKKVISFEQTNGTYEPAKWSSILQFLI